MSFTAAYLSEVASIANQLDIERIDACAELLADAKRRQGRVFVLGNGGSAANASHFVNDLRKIAGIEAYAPTDNVAELTARTNDDGWHTVFSNWLKTSRLSNNDLLFILSVGGGSSTVSTGLIPALLGAADVQAHTCAIVGREHGYSQRSADVCIVVPPVNEEHVTPHAESFQSVICHLLIWHPLLKA